MVLCESMGMKLGQFYEYVEHKIGSVFARWGRVVSRHAWKIIFAVIIINGALGIGIMRLTSNIVANDVYLPQNTRAREDQDKVQSIFRDLSGSNFQPLALMDMGAWAKVVVKSKTGNLLSRATLEKIKALNDIVLNITAKADDGSIIQYSSICAKSSGKCSVDGQLFWANEFLAAVDNGQVTYPEFSYPAGTTNYASDLGGKIQVSENGTLQAMEFINLDYSIRTDGSQYKEQAEIWVDAFVTRLETFTSPDFEIAYGHFNSLDEELDRNIGGDIAFFSATISLMITYACVATLSSRITDQVGQRMWLGFSGTLAAGLAILAAFGLVAACGVKFVSIVGVMPFLVIGIGIDDMFILLSGLSGAAGKITVEDRISDALRASGVGITITSLTDLLAFLVGAASNFVAVRNFCIYTGVSVVFCYINNITFFAACMAINERRVNDNRHYGTCMRIRTKEELKAEGKPRNYVICCGGRPPANRTEAESLADKLPRWLIPKLVLKTPLKIFIIFLFMGYMAAAIYGCVNLKQGLQFTQLVHEDSYFYKFSEWEEDNFARSSPVSFVIDKTYTYSDPTTNSLIEDLITHTQANKYFDGTFEVNWLKYYRTSTYYNVSSEANFITGLKNFLGNPMYQIFANDVVIDTVNNQITSSRVYVMSANLADSQEQGKMMLKARDIADSAAIQCFAFSPYFIAFEQYVAILPQTLQSVGIALAAVFVVTCIFMPHPVLILFVTVAVFMIMVGVFGFIYYMDVALSAITMIHLIMSIGFSIDFTAHICHGFMISDGKTRSIRVRQAIDKTGAPIFHGAVSSLLGIILLVGAKSYIFRTFAAVMALVLVFGIAHALLLLPVILSWIGPGRVNKVKANVASESQENGESKDNKSFSCDDGTPGKSGYEINGSNNMPTSVPPSSSNGLEGKWTWTEMKEK